MADQPAAKPKRRFKNPETFRERALKAAEVSDQPKRPNRLKGLLVTVFGPILRPIGKGFKSLWRSPATRWLHRPLRLIGKVIFPAYFRNSWRELKLVTWPSWRESRRLTFAVLVFAVVFGASIAIVDYGLDTVFRHILLK